MSNYMKEHAKAAGNEYGSLVDDNTSREELDNWKKRYKGYRAWKKKIPMKDLADLEEGHDVCFDDRNWFDKDSRMV